MAESRISRLISGCRPTALGDVLRDGAHPLSLVDPPPSVEPFSLSTAEFVVRPNGMPAVVVSGSCPPLASLAGWVLVVTTKGRDLRFGGVHPKVRDGSEAPFKAFFSLHSAPSSVHGMIAAAMHLDLICVRGGPLAPECMVFRYLPMPALLSAEGLEDCYGRAVGESPGAAS